MCVEFECLADLTGAQDGSVQLWEWGHIQSVASPRSAGVYAKVNRVRFSQHGNKFGVADSDGKLSLFQVGLSSNDSKSFFVSVVVTRIGSRNLSRRENGYPHSFKN